MAACGPWEWRGRVATTDAVGAATPTCIRHCKRPPCFEVESFPFEDPAARNGANWNRAMTGGGKCETVFNDNELKREKQWRLFREMVTAVQSLCKGKPTICKLMGKMTYFTEALNNPNTENLSIKHLCTFTSLSIPEAISHLYCSLCRETSSIGAGLIKQFLTAAKRFPTTHFTAYTLHSLF